MVSGLTLLRTDDNAISRGRWSYVLLAEELRRVTRRAAEERRGAVPAHVLQRADLQHRRSSAQPCGDREGAEWKLSPAYDLTPAIPISLERRDLAMACGDQGRCANAGNLLSQSARFLLTPDEANAIIDDVEAVVKSAWYRTLKGEGVSEQDAETLKGAFVYPGLRLAGAAAGRGGGCRSGPSPSDMLKPAPRRASTRKRKKAS